MPAWDRPQWAPRCCGERSRRPGFKDVTVVNQAISNLSDTHDLVVTHRDLTDRARQSTPSAIQISVDDFMGSPRYDEIVELLEQTTVRSRRCAGAGR